jgi:hypothetical protein
MGIFLPLIAADSLLVVRCERFVARTPFPPLRACVLDAAGTAAGFALAAVALGALREFFAEGALFGGSAGNVAVRAAYMPLVGLLLLSLLALGWNLLHAWRAAIPEEESAPRPAPKPAPTEYRFEELGSTSYAVERPGRIRQTTGTFPKVRQTTGTFPKAVPMAVPLPLVPPKAKRAKLLADFAAFRVVIPEFDPAPAAPPPETPGKNAAGKAHRSFNSTEDIDDALRSIETVALEESAEE